MRRDPLPGVRRAALAALVLVLPATTRAARAGHRDPGVDLESLKAELRLTWDSWHVKIRYEVEIEDAHPDRFDVIITFTECGHLLRDRLGRPIEIFDVLGYPSKIDDDELEFERRLNVRLPRGSIRSPKKLKVHVGIVDRCTGRIVQDKSTSAKWKRRG